MMKKLFNFSLLMILSSAVFSQQNNTEITSKNSWLKAGLMAGIPVGNLSDISSFTLGLDIKGQFMLNPHFGLGLTTGYNHFFPKEDYKSIGLLPVGAMFRYYPQSRGFFAGSDAGYTFLTGANDADGGFYIRPQLGFHNHDFNFFGYYNHVLRSDDNGGSVQHAGIGATYNIRFK
jgi:hypothetical protein